MTTAPSRRLAALLATLRADFSEITATLKALSVRRVHFAPAFMKAYGIWQKETGRTFVAFVQQLDSTVPADKDGYTNHPAFQTACYLRRLVEAPETRAGSRKSAMSPLDLAATVVRSTVPPDDLDFALSQIKHVTRWHARDMERFRVRVARARTVALLPHQPRLVSRAAHAARQLAADRSSHASH